MLVKTFGSAICGVNAMMVTVEVSVEMGVNFTLVGLPDSAVKESQQRIATAIGQYGLRIPGKRVVARIRQLDRASDRGPWLNMEVNGMIVRIIKCRIPDLYFKIASFCGRAV